ncbi:hypothetical protein LRP52_34235 [Photobacterium sp. ZSDE20]|uniref:Uncharacterized protein n=1 Tax=Photobacterium pectinilyticum TaxID=2906793 RepID=A0ABT1N5P7_9GAMM|nr:hypothetical protein [Photobacterium sp. ZSDE20]MCQ1060067.1 hypothetical protein [Photobacterium sp. ZSDE20]MDD1827247.1 hypothetical protein [Photobacterium sp. ZSDE20]
MAKHLNDKDINNVVELLDDWPTDTKLTWDKLVEAVQHDYKLTTTRQTLQKQPRIKSAYKEVKEIISGSPTLSDKGKKKLPASLSAAADMIEKRDRTIERLEKENRALLEQFHTWLYNSDLHGITIAQLSQPLPTKDE